MFTSWSDTLSRLQDYIFCISNLQFLFLFFFVHSFILILLFFVLREFHAHDTDPPIPWLQFSPRCLLTCSPFRFRSLPPPLILSITQQVHLLHLFVCVSGHLLEHGPATKGLIPPKKFPSLSQQPSAAVIASAGCGTSIASPLSLWEFRVAWLYKGLEQISTDAVNSWGQ